MWEFLRDWGQWSEFGIAVLVAIIAALVLHRILMRVLVALAKRSASAVDDLVLKYLRRPMRWLIVVLALRIATEPFGLPSNLQELTNHAFGIVLIALVAWLLIRATYILSDTISLRFDIATTDNLHARRIRTQVDALRRVLIVTILTIAVASILMTFPRIRQLGTAMLASAGIAGIVLGLAAQKTLGNLIAGLQIAFTQPMRIDDVVVVEGEWGRIEEITLTYVVVRIWDLRRLVLPITYFVEKPFQNWTRVSADILGTVFIYVDYTVPVEAIRAELGRILEGNDKWDGKVNVLQVTNATDRTLELRALMSAKDSGAAWDLRCLVREKLVEFVRKEYPHALPRVRAELERSENLPDAIP